MAQQSIELTEGFRSTYQQTGVNNLPSQELQVVCTMILMLLLHFWTGIIISSLWLLKFFMMLVGH